MLDRYKGVAKLLGNPENGSNLFAKNFANCHKLGAAGSDVGPDLSGLGDKPIDYLLTAILDPNRAVEARYISYVADTKAGLRLTGIIASESGNRLTLVGTDGKPQTVLRSDLENLSSTGKSLMPEGLETDLPPQAMADVLAYIKSNAVPPKPRTFVGNVPTIVRPTADGALTLWAPLPPRSADQPWRSRLVTATWASGTVPMTGLPGQSRGRVAGQVRRYLRMGV